MSACLGCSYIETHPVTLRDGTVVCSACPAWREECEVRAVAGMLTDYDRKQYLQRIRENRGEEAASRLRSRVWEWLKQG